MHVNVGFRYATPSSEEAGGRCACQGEADCADRETRLQCGSHKYMFHNELNSKNKDNSIRPLKITMSGGNIIDWDQFECNRGTTQLNLILLHV